MRPISRDRFNILAGYCRKPLAAQIAEELGWFEHGRERVLGVVIRDRVDNDFGGIVMGRDRKGRFRCIGQTKDFCFSKRRSEVALRREMERLSMAPDEEYYQGDEAGAPLDFFTPLGPSKQYSEDFIQLSKREGFSPARDVIESMMRWYEDADGNFVEQFQTAGFNARLWELYLFATLVEMGYRIKRDYAVPDFTCVGIPGEFTVEALTTNPTQGKGGATMPPPPRNTPEELHNFLREYMPNKFKSALTSKLKKEYWKRPNVSGKPLLFAIQDFSEPGSMVFTRSALPVYLYGFDYDWHCESTGNLKIIPHRLTKHQRGEKIIPSGFFDLPGAENVSAVLFNNSGTISKFNRMGIVAGFGSQKVVLIRKGFAFDHNPNTAEPRPFRHVVNKPGYSETWTEGLDVYHNPLAKYPIAPEALPGAAHHWLLPNGKLDSYVPDWHPLRSQTFITLTKNEEEAHGVAEVER